MHGSLSVRQEVSTSTVVEALVVGKNEVASEGSRFGGAYPAGQVAVMVNERIEIGLDLINIVRVNVCVASFSHVDSVQEVVHETDQFLNILGRLFEEADQLLGLVVVGEAACHGAGPVRSLVFEDAAELNVERRGYVWCRERSCSAVRCLV